MGPFKFFRNSSSSSDYDKDRSFTYEEDDEDPGVYRSKEEYLASGGPVDPCDDALWLHDEA